MRVPSRGARIYCKRKKKSNIEKISTLMKKVNVLELIEQILELTNDLGITTEVKNSQQQLVSPTKPYIKELMARIGMQNYQQNP